MMFGADGNPDETECAEIVHAALDAGVNLIDTADTYSHGQAEEFVGKAIAGHRDEIVLASKVRLRAGDGPNEQGASRLWIMRERGYGRIVTIASIAGKEGTPGVAAYCAAKAGVIGFSKALARELVTAGVMVNCIAPVMTETELLKEMTTEHIARAREKIPMGRFCTVEEISAMAAWVASPECSFTTGSVFDLSGGRATY